MYHFDAIDLKEGEYEIDSNYEPQLYQETINRNSIITIYGTDLKPYNSLLSVCSHLYQFILQYLCLLGVKQVNHMRHFTNDTQD